MLYFRENQPVSIDDQGASDGILGKLRKLDRRMQEVNEHWEEMQQVKRGPQPPQRSSSQRVITQQSQTLPKSRSVSMRSKEIRPKKLDLQRRRPRQWTSEVDGRSGPSILEGPASDRNQSSKVVEEKMQKLSNAPQESAVTRSYADSVSSQPPLHQRSTSTMAAGPPGVRTRKGTNLYKDLEEVSLMFI